MLFRQHEDKPVDIRLEGAPRKFDEAASPTDSAGVRERAGFSARQLAQQHGFGHPVCVTFFWAAQTL